MNRNHLAASCRILLLALPTLLLAACGGDVVATVDNQEISGEQLRAFVEKLPDGLRSPYEGDAARQHYLQSLIDRRLMLLQAHADGLDTAQVVVNAVDDATRGRLVTLYRTTVVMPRAAVSDEELDAYAKAQGYGRKRKLNAILVHTRQEIDGVKAALDAGTPFAEVARLHSLDKRSARQGGELGFIDLVTAERLYIPREVFRDLPQGQVSKPLPAAGSWHVVRFVDEQPDSTQAWRQLAMDEVFSSRLEQVEDEEIEQLSQRYAVALDEAGLATLTEAYANRQTAGLEHSDEILYTIGTSHVKVGAARRILRRGAPASLLADPNKAPAVLEQMILRPFLYAYAALDQGLTTKKKLAADTKRLIEDTLLEVLRHRLMESIDVSEAEVRQFYDDHPEQFVHENAVWTEELLLPTEAEAEQARSLIESGKDFAQLAGRSLRAGAEEHGARSHYHPREVALYPRLIPLLLAAKPGELSGPYEVDSGWEVFRVIRQDEGGLEPYEQVQRRARALVLRRHQEKALGGFLRQLRKTYADRVTVYPDRLAAALPAEVL